MPHESAAATGRRLEQLAGVAVGGLVAVARRPACGRSRRPAPRRRPARRVAVAWPPSTLFSIRKWRLGQRGDLRQVGDAEDLALRRRAPAAARRPPGRCCRRSPASISSKTRSRRRRCAPWPASASITRESSPPEAASRSGEVGIPGLVATWKLDRLLPERPEAVGVRLERDLELRAAHRQLVELGGDPLLRAAARPWPAPRSAARRARSRCASAFGQLGLEPARSPPRRPRASRSPPGSARRGPAPPRSMPPCLRFSRSSASSRSSTCSSRPGSASIPSA